jgi:microcystin-dependent protein
MKQIFLLLSLLFVANNAFAVCSSPISRTNNTASQVLTSTKYNLDLNTVYAKVNNLPGDCITDDSISTVKLEDEAVTADKIAAAVLAKFTPAGSILAFGGTVAPTGYLLCDGSAVSRTTYADLFAVIGTAFGSGNGSTTFNLPDFRGRFLRGVDGGAGRDPDRATRTAMNSGGNTADNVGSIQSQQYPSHAHTFTIGTNIGAVANSFAASNASTPGDGTTLSGNATVTTTSSGTGTENRPLNASVNYIIKF